MHSASCIFGVVSIFGAVKIEPRPGKIFLFEKSFSRLFSVQENNLANAAAAATLVQPF
jgi:hypothetical protein